MFDPLAIFRFVATKQRAGQGVVLVTAMRVRGSSTRQPGTQMAVAEDGQCLGSFSGGCIEPAIVGEALSVMRAGCPREVTFGSGSPYIDIRLPCGGSLDLHFFPLEDGDLALAVLASLERRRPSAIRLSRNTTSANCLTADCGNGVIVTEDEITVGHTPPMRLVILGTGESVEKLAKVASAIGIVVAVGTPQESLLERLAGFVKEAALLKTVSGVLPFEIDMWTAAVTLFHDHDWEPPVIKQILDSTAYFVGAMGSKQTHAARLIRLRESSVSREQASRVISPIGLLPSMRDPETLAVSILAQVVSEYNRLFLARVREN